MLNENIQAPDFTLTDAAGAPHSLSDFRGQWVVLYFYPRDNTPGCTRQACAFASAYSAFQAKNAVVIGVSKDSAASHQKFAAKYELPFLLLSDPDHAVLELYDVWKEKKQYGLSTWFLFSRKYFRILNSVTLHSISCCAFHTLIRSVSITISPELKI